MDTNHHQGGDILDKHGNYYTISEERGTDRWIVNPCSAEELESFKSLIKCTIIALVQFLWLWNTYWTQACTGFNNRSFNNIDFTIKNIMESNDT